MVWGPEDSAARLSDAQEKEDSVRQASFHPTHTHRRTTRRKTANRVLKDSKNNHERRPQKASQPGNRPEPPVPIVSYSKDMFRESRSQGFQALIKACTARRAR